MTKPSTVGQYLAAQTDVLRDIGTTMQPIIEAQLPAGSGAIWHGHPVWSLGAAPGKDPVCLLKAYPTYLSFGLWRGHEIRDPSGRLEPSPRAMAYVKLRTLADIDPALFAGWLRQARELASTAASTPTEPAGEDER